MSRVLVMMRHGNADKNKLTEIGERQIEDTTRQMIGAGIVPDIIVHSEITRAVQSAGKAQLVFLEAGHQVTLRADPNLNLVENDRESHDVLNAFRVERFSTVIRSLGDKQKVLFITHQDGMSAAAEVLIKAAVDSAYASNDRKEQTTLMLPDNGGALILVTNSSWIKAVRTDGFEYYGSLRPSRNLG